MRKVWKDVKDFAQSQNSNVDLTNLLQPVHTLLPEYIVLENSISESNQGLP